MDYINEKYIILQKKRYETYFYMIIFNLESLMLDPSIFDIVCISFNWTRNI